MLPSDCASLWETLGGDAKLSQRFASVHAAVALGDLAAGSCLPGRAGELAGRSVLIAARDQLVAALALIELDGVARRLVLCPPELPAEHISFVIDSVPVDAVVSDYDLGLGSHPAIGPCIIAGPEIAVSPDDRTPRHKTEWVLLTSGTTGRPKMVVHTLASLTGAIEQSSPAASSVVWSTFYDIRRYGGLQIFLRAVLTGASLVLSSSEESTADFLTRAGAHGVTHISGTPSHWRRALMSGSAQNLNPQYVRLSGEIADQAILDHLRTFYPQAKVAHAFASTEAGVAFDVRDGLAGFPASVIGSGIGGVDMKVEDGSLRIRSARTAARYIGPHAGTLADADGFIDTGDMLELRDGRYYFVGRRDGVINVGGLKVHPEEVEAVINQHPGVQMCLVRARKNSLTGALVVADVVLRAPPDTLNGQVRETEQEILQLCRATLPRHKVPAAIRFVSGLEVASTGKISRQP
ncbi:MAG TPA: class I adenylate-forming enzyme family protein [Bryobacteraceae bacterium]|nr:class I adenylate-forming enzyme family protein [Bryobacteraceae bacterium]